MYDVFKRLVNRLFGKGKEQNTIKSETGANDDTKSEEVEYKWHKGQLVLYNVKQSNDVLLCTIEDIATNNAEYDLANVTLMDVDSVQTFVVHIYESNLKNCDASKGAIAIGQNCYLHSVAKGDAGCMSGIKAKITKYKSDNIRLNSILSKKEKFNTLYIRRDTQSLIDYIIEEKLCPETVDDISIDDVRKEIDENYKHIEHLEHVIEQCEQYIALDSQRIKNDTLIDDDANNVS